MYRVQAADLTADGEVFQILDRDNRRFAGLRLHVRDHADDLCYLLNLASAMREQRDMGPAESVALIDGEA